MYLNGIGTAAPPSRYTKLDCWEAFRRSEWFERLHERTRALVRAILLSENGMEARRLAVPSLAEAFRIDPDTLYQRFLTTAPGLAIRAGAASAAQHHGIRPRRAGLRRGGAQHAPGAGADRVPAGPQQCSLAVRRGIERGNVPRRRSGRSGERMSLRRRCRRRGLFECAGPAHS